MRPKTLAVLGDLLLLVLLVGGVAWLLLRGTMPNTWTTDRSLLPLSTDGSRFVLLFGAASILAWLVLAFVLPRGKDRIVAGQVVRYNPFERLVHWGIALGYVLAFISGALLLRWLGLQTGIDNRPLVYQVHFVGAILITTAGFLLVATYRTQGRDSLFPRAHDISPALARLFGYLGIYGQPGVLGLRWPRAWQAPTQRFLAAIGIRPNGQEDKFLSVEKVFSFTPLAVLTVIVVATGLLKAGRYFFAVPGDVLYWTTWLHDLTTTLTVVVVGAHLAAIFLVPRNWPGIRAMVNGRISHHVVEDEFPAWAARLDQPEPPAVVLEGRPAPGPAPH